MSLFLFSCNDEPTPVGYSLVNDTLSFHNLSSETDGILASLESVFKPTLQVNNKAFFVGKANGVRAASILRFDGGLPDSLLSFIKEDDIHSIKLKLTPYRYVFGDSANTMQSFKVYQMNKLWTFDLTWDSVFAGNQIIDYSDGKITQTAELDIPLQDTMARIEIDLTTDQFKKDYLRWLAEDDRDTTKTLTNWGLLLAPGDNSNHISSFTGQLTGNDEITGYPELEIIYDHKDGRLDTITTKSNIDASMVDIDDKSDNGFSLMLNAEILAEMEIDVRSIPERAGVHKSYLEFTLDLDNSDLGNFPKDSIIAANFRKKDSTLLSYYFTSDENGVFKLDFMQQAVENIKAAGGLGTIELAINRSGNAGIKLDRLRFYGMDAVDPEKRPKFKIVYSMIVEKGGK
jgi:hypothetical protein